MGDQSRRKSVGKLARAAQATYTGTTAKQQWMVELMTHAIPDVVLAGLEPELERRVRTELSARYTIHSVASIDAVDSTRDIKRIIVMAHAVAGKSRPEGLCRHTRERFPECAMLVLCRDGADLTGLADLGLVEAAGMCAAPGEILLRISGLIEQLAGQFPAHDIPAGEPCPEMLEPRAFVRRAHAEADRVRRYGGALALLAIAASEDAIVVAEQTCLETLRESDVVGRVAPDIMGVLLPETGVAIAVEVARRVRDAYGSANSGSSNGNAIRFAVTSISVFDEDHGIEGAVDAACAALAGEPADGVRVL